MAKGSLVSARGAAPREAASLPSVPVKRPFPLEAIVVFPLVGPPALAFAVAAAYAAALMIFLDFRALLALPVYGVFWTVMFFPLAAPPLALAGMLYAVAVRWFAPPHLVTALAAGALGAAIFVASAWLAMRIFPLDVERFHLTPNDIVPGSVGCVLAVIPGWWVSRKIARWRAARRGGGA
jgi:hypothetical protein